MKNYLLKVSLSSEEFKKRIKNMESIVQNLDQKITDTTSVLVIARRFMRLRGAAISMTMIIEEKSINECVITLVMVSGFKEGFWRDTNAGKSMRNDLIKYIEGHVTSFEDITTEEIRSYNSY